MTASCPNTGSMLGLDDARVARVAVGKRQPDPQISPYVGIIEADLGQGPHIVGINSGRPNALVTEAIQAGLIPELSGYSNLRREVKYGINSRIDVLLSGGPRAPRLLRRS